MNLFADIGNFFNMVIYRPLGFLLGACYQVGRNYGIALILFTLVTRVLMIPLAIKQQKSSAEMIRMQPKMAEIQKKIKDKTKQAEELQKLYQEEGYSPFAGCLPLLIQLPIIYGLFGVIYKPLTYILGLTAVQVNKVVATLTPQIQTMLHHAINSGDQSKIEIYAAQAMNGNMDKLSFLPHKIMALDFNFLGVDLSKTPSLSLNILILIPILCYVTNFLYMWVNMKMMATPTTQNNPMNNKMMMVLMPIMSTVFSLQLPAGIGFYWIITNLFMIVQVYVINIFYNPKKLAEQAEIAAKKRKDARAAARKAAIAANKSDDKVTEGSDKPSGISDTAEAGPDEEKKKSAKALPQEMKSKKQIKEENRKRLAASRKMEKRGGQDK
ncbi:MAG TPA: YidC/Oxa1 family membrane protein insertase [Clostridia bacterium]|nr:YidC/Oxa1 family membrane protein insertase [Clostridia bacterium]